jgi:hypothetical protein
MFLHTSQFIDTMVNIYIFFLQVLPLLVNFEPTTSFKEKGHININKLVWLNYTSPKLFYLNFAKKWVKPCEHHASRNIDTRKVHRGL